MRFGRLLAVLALAALGVAGVSADKAVEKEASKSVASNAAKDVTKAEKTKADKAKADKAKAEKNKKTEKKGDKKGENSQEDGGVRNLLDSDFDDFQAKNDVFLAMIHAPWCGHCKALAPEYAKAHEALAKKGGIPLVKIDATSETGIVEKFKDLIRGYPTVVLFDKNREEPTMYDGGRTASAIVNWVELMTGPAVEFFGSASEMEKAMKKDGKREKRDADKKDDDEKSEEAGPAPGAAYKLVATLPNKTAAESETFIKVAEANRRMGSFFAVIDSGVSAPSLELRRPDEDPVKPENASAALASVSALQQFVDKESVPYFGGIDASNFAMYGKRATTTVYFCGAREDYEKYGKEMRVVSKEKRDEPINFVWLDIGQYKFFSDDKFGLKKYPALAMTTMKAKEGDDKSGRMSDLKYRYTGELNVDKIRNFVESVKAGTLAPYYKTEEAPATNDEPVKIVVGSTFEEMVLQKDKDVFIAFKASWCGHCKALQPIWKEFAERTKESKNFMVAEFDGVENEPSVSGFEYRGFPTIFFVKAGSSTPMNYDGGRKVEDFIEFAKKNAAHPLKVSEAAKNEKETEKEDKDEL